MPAQEADQRDFSTVGDCFEGVGEGFGQGQQLGRALGFGKLLNGDVVRGRPALDFEGVALGFEGLEGFQEGGTLGDFVAVVGVGRRGGSEFCLVSVQAGVAAVDLLVEIALGRIDETGCAKNILAAVLHKPLNIMVLHHASCSQSSFLGVIG